MSRVPTDHQDGRNRSDLIAACFGDNLANARRRMGLTQTELGDQAGLHRTAIGMLESGDRICRVDTPDENPRGPRHSSL